MIDSLLASLKEWWDDLKWFTWVYEYETGIKYHKGEYHSSLETGLNWKIPVIQDIRVVSKQDDTKQLRSQTVNEWVVSPIVCYYVKNPRRYYTNVLSDGDSIVDDITAGVITSIIHANADENPMDLLESINEEVKSDCLAYGLMVRSVNFASCAKIQTMRLMIDKELEEVTE